MNTEIKSAYTAYQNNGEVKVEHARLLNNIFGFFVGELQIEVGGNFLNISFDDEVGMREFCEKHNIEVEDLRIKAVK